MVKKKLVAVLLVVLALLAAAIVCGLLFASQGQAKAVKTDTSSQTAETGVRQSDETDSSAEYATTETNGEVDLTPVYEAPVVTPVPTPSGSDQVTEQTPAVTPIPSTPANTNTGETQTEPAQKPTEDATSSGSGFLPDETAKILNHPVNESDDVKNDTTLLMG